MSTLIKKATREMDKLDWGNLGILAEYLYTPHWVADFDEKNSKFYNIIIIYRDLDRFGQESLKCYLAHRKNKIISERQ